MAAKCGFCRQISPRGHPPDVDCKAVRPPHHAASMPVLSMSGHHGAVPAGRWRRPRGGGPSARAGHTLHQPQFGRPTGVSLSRSRDPVAIPPCSSNSGGKEVARKSGPMYRRPDCRMGSGAPAGPGNDLAAEGRHSRRSIEPRRRPADHIEPNRTARNAAALERWRAWRYPGPSSIP